MEPPATVAPLSAAKSGSAGTYPVIPTHPWMLNTAYDKATSVRAHQAHARVVRHLSADIAHPLPNPTKQSNIYKHKLKSSVVIWRGWRRRGIFTLRRLEREKLQRVLTNTHVQLRDIEILVQQKVESLEAAGSVDETLKEIQKILYSTEVRITLYRPIAHPLTPI